MKTSTVIDILEHIEKRLDTIEAFIQSADKRRGSMGLSIPLDLPPTRFGRSKVYRDTELRQFVTELLQDEHEVKDIRIAAVKKFGEDRVPSMSSVYRFVIALRKEVEARRNPQQAR